MLTKISQKPLDREELRRLRALEALEAMATDEARAILARLADGTPSPATTAAQSSLLRLKSR